MQTARPPLPEERIKMDGQQYVRFSAEVHGIVNGNWRETEELVVPLFRELSPEEEREFREHARENYVPGDPINDVFHPIWKDEAHKMNAEVASHV